MKALTTVFLIITPWLLHAQDITGQWHGTLDMQGNSLRVVFRIEDTDGQLTATMDSPDQGATGIATTRTTFEDNQLTITADALGMTYEGTLQDSTIAGTFRQGGLSMPLTLTRTAGKKPEAVVRPQDPTSFPYRQEAVYFTNPEGHRLAGTLTLPEDGTFEKVVVLISGSGPQDRNEEGSHFNHRPFLVLSDHLTRHGIAVLRYDDRGVAESEGDFNQATSEDFAKDAQAAVTFLQERADMQGKAIGLIGHSEGGMIAPMVASQHEAVDFIVLLAAPGIPISELLVLQADQSARAEGVPDDIREANLKTIKAAYDYLTTHQDVEKPVLKEGLLSVFREGFENMPKRVRQEEDTTGLFEKEANRMLTNWFLYFVNYDPAEYLRQVPCPVLAINGALDVQVPANKNLMGIEAALQAGGNANVTVKKMKAQNHLFQRATTGAVSEYGKIDETFNEKTMQYVTDWIEEQTKP